MVIISVLLCDRQYNVGQVKNAVYASGNNLTFSANVKVSKKFQIVENGTTKIILSHSSKRP